MRILIQLENRLRGQFMQFHAKMCIVKSVFLESARQNSQRYLINDRVSRYILAKKNMHLHIDYNHIIHQCFFFIHFLSIRYRLNRYQKLSIFPITTILTCFNRSLGTKVEKKLSVTLPTIFSNRARSIRRRSCQEQKKRLAWSAFFYIVLRLTWCGSRIFLIRAGTEGTSLLCPYYTICRPWEHRDYCLKDMLLPNDNNRELKRDRRRPFFDR